MAALLDPAVLRNICDEVRERFPVSGIAAGAVKLQRSGNEWKACCPFHADRTPSFTIYAGDRRWWCFGCGLGGDVIDFVQRQHGVGLREAVVMLDAGALPVVEREIAARCRTVDEPDLIEAARRIWQRAAEVREGTPPIATSPTARSAGRSPGAALRATAVQAARRRQRSATARAARASSRLGR